MKKLSFIAVALFSLSATSMAREITEVIEIRRGEIREDQEINLTQRMERQGSRISRNAELIEVRLVRFDGNFANVTLEAGDYSETLRGRELRRNPVFRLSPRQSRLTSNANWYLFVDRSDVYVDYIEVTYDNGRRTPQPNPDVITDIFTCESFDDQLEECRIDGEILSVQIRENISSTLCVNINNIALPVPAINNWGHTRDSIWVAFGCRADFRVTYRPYGR